jgi:hypothetical protein
MGCCHLSRLAEREGSWRKHQQRRSPAELSLPSDPRRLEASVGINTVNDRRHAADFLAGNLHHATLLVSVEWALIVIADRPCTAPMSRR